MITLTLIKFTSGHNMFLFLTKRYIGVSNNTKLEDDYAEAKKRKPMSKEEAEDFMTNIEDRLLKRALDSGDKSKVTLIYY